ncbi:hypothetical protein Ccrd_011427, partial [Cynara cardunculus var. scolymus]
RTQLGRSHRPPPQLLPFHSSLKSVLSPLSLPHPPLTPSPSPPLPPPSQTHPATFSPPPPPLFLEPDTPYSTFAQHTMATPPLAPQQPPLQVTSSTHNDSQTHPPSHDQESRAAVPILAKNPSGRKSSRSTSLEPELDPFSPSGGGFRTTHKNLCPLFSNPIAISFNCSFLNTPILPKHKNTTLLLGCESNHFKHSFLLGST